MIEWKKLNKEDMLIISQIADRYIKIFSLFGQVNKNNKQDVIMDITACHITECKLNLQDLLEASEYDFCHDIIGIRTNIDRDTGELKNCFVPRYALKKEKKVI